MKLNLTTWQRIEIIVRIRALRGDANLLRKAMKLLDILELTDEEQSEISLRTTKEGNLMWKNPDTRWEIEIADGNLVAFIQEVIGAEKGWPVQNAQEILDLLEQLGLAAE